MREFYLFRAVLHEESKNFLMAEVTCYLVRSSIRAQGWNIVGACTAWIVFGKILVRDTHTNAVRIGLDVPAHKVQIPKCGSQEDVRLAAARDEIACNVLPVTRIVARLNHPDHVLSRGGFVHQVPGINIRSPLKQELGNLDKGSEVQTEFVRLDHGR